ncbi:MAG: NAD(P)H-dependent glycerol-3-phosphate dehydrogenase [Pseudomonadota bacterium]
MAFRKIGLIGAGAWGTALAQSLCHKSLDVLLWAYEDQSAVEINAQHTNSVFLPDIALHPDLRATSHLEDLSNCDVILLVTPVQFTRDILKRVAVRFDAPKPIVICSKGIETATQSLLSEVVSESLSGTPISVLSGPSFANEVAMGLPVALTLACHDKTLGMDLIHTLGQKNFRLYWSDDVIGAQIGGAVKNVMAIACGISTGKKLGANAHAALMTRGFSEFAVIGKSFGAQAETLSGLSGLGDLLLTCSQKQSRNMSLGFALGEGHSVESILSQRRSVTEGVHTTIALHDIAQTRELDLPICSAVYDILQNKTSVDEAIERLLSRPFKEEHSL